MANKIYPSFAETKTLIDKCGGWRKIFEHFAGASLADAIAKADVNPNGHVDCPMSHNHQNGGINDFRLLPSWKDDGRYFCTCGNQDGFFLLVELGIFNSATDAKNAIHDFLMGDATVKPAQRQRPSKTASTAKKANALDPKKAASRAKFQRWIWHNKALPLTHPDAEPARLYLAKRGVPLGVKTDMVRFNPNQEVVKWNDGKKHVLAVMPALLCYFSDVNGNLTTLHQVFITNDGEKAVMPDGESHKQAMLLCKSTLNGSAGRVVGIDNCKTLNISEGVEKALAVARLTGETTWSGSSGAVLSNIEVPGYFTHVRIWADRDGNGAGAKSAAKLVGRLLAKGFTVEVMMPHANAVLPGETSVDWEDLIAACSAYELPKNMRYQWACNLSEKEGLQIAA